MKKLISIALSIVMLFSVLTIVVSAEPSVTFPGITGASYDSSTKTLTLSNASASDGYINIVGTDVIINLVGTSTITSTSFGITSDSNIKFTGSGNLTINAGASSAALVIEGGSKVLDFSGTGTITFKTLDCEAIKVDGQIKFNNGTVVAQTSSGIPAIIAYGVTKEDTYNDVAIDDEVGTYGISYGTDMAPTTSVNVVDVQPSSGSAIAKDDYYTGSTITDAYGNTYTKYLDQYGNPVIDAYDKYGNKFKDAYPADNATGASWSYTMTYSVKTLSTGTVKLDANDWVYSGSTANSVTVQKKTTPPSEKITLNSSGAKVYQLKNAGSTPVIDKIPSNTTVSQLMNNLANDNAKLKVFNISGKQVTSGEVGTKFTVRLYINGSEVDRRTLVVLGDVKAQDDVKINSQDYQMIKQHIMSNYTLLTDPILKLAADAYSDSKIDSRDYQKIKQIIMSR